MQIEVIEVKPVPPPKEYILRLNQNELDYLAALLGKVGGYDGLGGWREVGNKMGSHVYNHATNPNNIAHMLKGNLVVDANSSVKPV